jgi:hypothetical protein
MGGSENDGSGSGSTVTVNVDLERVASELVASRIIDCRTCAYGERMYPSNRWRCTFGREYCIGGNRHTPTLPVILYSDA